MASGSGCSDQSIDLRLSDYSCTMDDSMVDSRNVTDFATTTFASVADSAIPSTSYFSALEEQIDRSKAHWSTLVDESGYTEEEKLDFEVSNMQEFEALQRHPTYGNFFANFSGDGISIVFGWNDGELVVGRKFAEGSQAELYEAQVKWVDPWNTEIVQRYKRQFVLKVFKEGTLLKQLKSQLPKAVMLYHVARMELLNSGSTDMYPIYVSQVHCGILLKGGRFAFLMRRLHFDLRTLIDRNMKFKTGEECGLFSKEEVEIIMYEVALGVYSLHNRDTVHRDLKASTVLVLENENERRWCKWRCFVADYECSIGVVGTHFFRAPEILQVCKDRKVNKRPEVFSKAVYIYSYGMTCYEILTGKLPFENHPLRDNSSLLMDLVINHHLRPEVPEYVEVWARELLGRCWQLDPTTRPTIGEILDVLSTNFAKVRGYESVNLKIF